MEIGRRPFGGLRHAHWHFSFSMRGPLVEIGRRPFGGLRHSRRRPCPRPSSHPVEIGRRPFGGLRHFPLGGSLGRESDVEIGRRPFGGLRHLRPVDIRQGHATCPVEIGRRPFGGLRQDGSSAAASVWGSRVEIGRRPFGGLRHFNGQGIPGTPKSLGGNRPSTLRGIETLCEHLKDPLTSSGNRPSTLRGIETLVRQPLGVASSCRWKSAVDPSGD